MSMDNAAAQQDAALSLRLAIPLSLLWLAGITLRLTVLAVPPVIPLIHADLALSETAIGLLSSIPPLLFTLAAVPGSLLIARFGARTTLVFGLVLMALASALRGAAGAPILFAMTFLMSLGIAIMQPALPPLVRDWLPQRIGFATAVYSNGLLIGEILPVALAAPLILPLVGGSWRWSFGFWALPVLATALLVAMAGRRSRGDHPVVAAPGAPRRWWPDWRDPLIWRLGFILGSGQSIYFAANAFLPDYLTAIGHPELIHDALTALNLWQLPASLLLLAFAGRLTRRAWPYVAVGLLMLGSIVGMLAMASEWVVFWSGMLGFCAAFCLILSLALPPLLSPPGDVHRLSAAMFTISYALAVVVPILGGFVWDLTASPVAAFVPLALCALTIVTLAATVKFRPVMA